jgi:hypothetical protein
MKAAKKARNFFSHNIEIMPSPSDALFQNVFRFTKMDFV